MCARGANINNDLKPVGVLTKEVHVFSDYIYKIIKIYIRKCPLSNN